MRDIPNKTNLISSYDADEFNEFYSDVANCVISESIALDGADEDQLEESVNRKVTIANKFAASGGADVIVLSPNAPRKGPKVLADGMVVRFLPTGDNTTTTPTVNISTLGARTIVRNLADDPLIVGDIKQGFMRELTYSFSLDKFYITQGELSTFNTVETASIDDSAITTAKIATNAVTNVEIATDTILATNIGAGQVGTSEIATNAVTNVEIGTDTILATNIAPSAVGSSEIAPDAVGTSEIAVNAVTNIEIGVNTILATNIATDAVGSDEIAANAVGSSEIATNAVTNVEIATDTILSTNIGAGQVGQSELSTNSVISDKIFAGAVTNAKIGSSAVHQSNLQTTTQTGSVGSENVGVVFTGGEYCLSPQVRVNSGTYVNISRAQAEDGGGDSAFAVFASSATEGHTLDFKVRYIQASPPYAVGGVEFPLFAYLILDNNGEIETCSFSQDPCWAYNGKTDIRPDEYREDGKRYKSIYDFDGDLKLYLKNNPKKYMEMRKSKELQKIEVTTDFKNSDMNDIPHPFVFSDNKTRNIILCAPQEKLIIDFEDIQKEGGDMVNIFKNYVKIENTEQSIPGLPNQLKVFKTSWK